MAVKGRFRNWLWGAGALRMRPTAHACDSAGVRRVGRNAGLGQMTVEFVVMFPVALVVALVAVNATLFFSECATFDRVFRNAVCTYAPSPAAGQDEAQSCVLVQQAVQGTMDAENLEVNISVSGAGSGSADFTGELLFEPTLFGIGPLTGAFGVTFPSLRHVSAISVDVYKPGVFL